LHGYILGKAANQIIYGSGLKSGDGYGQALYIGIVRREKVFYTAL